MVWVQVTWILPFASASVPSVDRGVADADITNPFAKEPVLAVCGVHNQRRCPLVGFTRAVGRILQIIRHKLDEAGLFLFHVLVFLVHAARCVQHACRFNGQGSTQGRSPALMRCPLTQISI